jgi:hypothetical protein
MAEEKKYTAKEAALAVLRKAEEILKKSEMMTKKENPDEKQDAALGEKVEGLCEKHMMENKSAEKKEGHKMVKQEACLMCKSMQKSEFKELYADLGDLEVLLKAENKAAPSNPMKPEIKQKPTERDFNDFETKPGNAPAPDHRQASQPAPGANPKEQIEGNNPQAGTVPQKKGVHKLMHFRGMMDGKRSASQKAVQASEPDMARSEIKMNKSEGGQAKKLPNVKGGPKKGSNEEDGTEEPTAPVAAPAAAVAAPDEPANFSTSGKDKMVKSQRSGMHTVEYHKASLPK